MSIDKSLILDNTPYHCIDTNDIPPGYAEADVKLDGNGVEIDCTLTAGLVGRMVRDSKEAGWEPSRGGGWWMF